MYAATDLSNSYTTSKSTMRKRNPCLHLHTPLYLHQDSRTKLSVGPNAAVRLRRITPSISIGSYRLTPNTVHR